MPIELTSPSGEKLKQFEWTFASRTQCLTCHNAWAEYSLAFNTLQLCGEERRGKGTRDDAEIMRLTRGGFIRRVDDKGKDLPPFDAAGAAKEPALNRKTLDAQARSYLHANCAHCHRFGGGGAVSAPHYLDDRTKSL